MRIVKKLDIIIIVFLLILSFTPHLIFSNILAKNYSSAYVNIKIAGKVYDNIELSSFKGEKKIVIATDHGNNTVFINNGSVKIIEADCNDSLCVKQGLISDIGETLICLPNKLILEIKGDERGSSNDTILSH